MSQKHRTAVEMILKSSGVTFTAACMGEVKNALSGNRPMDKWSVSFAASETGDKAGGTEYFDFYTGTGLRKVPEWKYGVAGYGVMGYDNGPAPQRGTLLHEQWMQQAKPQAPHAADVLHSLILDSGAVGQSFEAWCGDLGYDTDSRAALATYEACQQNADKLARLFTREEISALSEALQDH